MLAILFKQSQLESQRQNQIQISTLFFCGAEEKPVSLLL